ncbi:protein NRT1/ PTR FAMILY 5.10 [Citrus sinensis]|uniref:Protein NRT1/ PTR FAMILY 5.10 n=1 Tax=Citrus sinensis TaxID=2711 RepID=A0ACB8KUS6_CITSI|nr:protein NRT1/ PTR FAMILY 5.10 [Citrus sinensis]
MDISDTETSMLQRQDTVDDCADYRGRPVHRANSGGWKSRLAFCGTGSNLITYLTGPLGQSTATAAQNANKWSGTSQLLPLLGAFVADSFLGLLAQGGQRPCVQAVGADQFDEKHPEECKLKSPFFNWWYFGMCTSSIFTHFIISSVQENLYWGLGFGIPCISMAIAPIVFLLGTKSYRYTMKGNGMNPFLRIGKVFVAAIRNFRAAAPSAMALEQEAGTIYSDQFKFLNKALAVPPDGSEAYAKAPSISEVEEAKALLRLVPIWTTITVYGIVSAQQPTFFTKQEARMDRSITPGCSHLCLQEHFYDQVPTELRSVRLSLYLSIFGVAVLAAL